MRYPFAALAEAMGVSESQACRVLKLSGSTEQEYRREGMTERVADRLAVAAGFHAFSIWPEMLDAQIESVEVECAASDCHVRFVPGWRGPVKFCSSRCKKRQFERDKRGTPDPVQCAATDCGTMFVPSGRGPQKFCSTLCRHREWALRYRSTPEGAEKNRAKRRRYYGECGDYERARQRRYNRARRAA